MISYFLVFEDSSRPATRLAQQELARVGEIIGQTPGLTGARIYTPDRTRDPYLNDGPPPILAIQLYFGDIEDLERALAESGALQSLLAPGALPSLAGAEASQQAMLARVFPVPDPVFRPVADRQPCTYLVGYEGPAEDLNAWLSYYIASHPPIMARFPGIRQIEIYSRIDWCSAFPARRADYMQRNKVVFDDAAALTAALNSPVRHEMRSDFHKLPAFKGRVTHYPMATLTIG
jgi:hypothetical protein